MSENINYHRIAQAIDYIKDNFRHQPSLDEVAAHVHLSPAHFQRMFTDWAGTSPKKFLQYISLAYAKSMLAHKDVSLFDAAYETGLSSTSRLHDLFVKIEAMTPGEYKNGGKNLSINYSFYEGPFGSMIVASTGLGVCYMAFEENEQKALDDLKARFPEASYHAVSDLHQQRALAIFKGDGQTLEEIRLHLKGTQFQLRVWESLLKIPAGKLTTYQVVAGSIGKPSASRAVGSAIGSNPVAFLIPCHRVIQSTGALGGYMWGNTRKTAIIGWEGARVNS